MTILRDNQNVSFDSTIVILPFSLYFGEKELPLFLNVQKVYRVTEPLKFSPLPEALAPLEAIYDLEGMPIPVLDLKRCMPVNESHLVGSGTPGRRRQRVITVNLQGAYIGFVVDHTLNVRRQENASLLPPPSALRFRDEMFFNAVVREGQGYRYMLDIESILAGAGINLGGSMQTGVVDQSLKGARVLIVEDSRLFQRLAKDSLEKRGAHVSLAENGEQGLAMLLDEASAYDLVISDIEMPIMNGIEMVRRYKKTVAKPAPVLFHSSISNEATSKDILDEGLGEYLLKFEEGHIIHTACRLIREGRDQKAA